MATHDTARGSVEYVCCAKTQNATAECPARGYFPLKGVGKRNAAAASAWSFMPHARCTRQLLAQAGCQALRVTSRPDRRSAASRDDRAVIKIQILDPQLQTLTDPCPFPLTLTNKRLTSRKPRMRTHFIRGQHHRQAPARRRRSSDL